MNIFNLQYILLQLQLKMFGINCVDRLEPCKSSGPDKCHPRLILELKEGLVKPLCMIFGLSLRDGVLPIMWKRATVTAIHKKGNRNLPNNYQPVSLTSVICKINAREYC